MPLRIEEPIPSRYHRRENDDGIILSKGNEDTCAG